ncbi:ribosomal protein L7/L12 [Sphingopyxis sp.]|uniref:ribosomal protein L7/L12 n=1 Tax=Sphingopyxis sp. TaxID=1908224 RepID=UPI003D80F2B6
MGKLLILVVGLALGLLLARYLRGQKARRDLTAPPRGAPRPMVRVGDERIDDEEIREMVRQDRKIEAIKLVRERTGFTLAEAKDAVEAIERQLP